jgi:hypothetical protein
MDIIIVCLTTGKTISFNTFFSIKCYLEGVWYCMHILFNFVHMEAVVVICMVVGFTTI